MNNSDFSLLLSIAAGIVLFVLHFLQERTNRAIRRHLLMHEDAILYLEEKTGIRQRKHGSMARPLTKRYLDPEQDRPVSLGD